MAIASTRIRLPHLDERIGHRATVAVENVAVDDGLFADRFAGLGVVMDQIIVERTSSSDVNAGPLTSDSEFCSDHSGMRGERNTLVL